MTNTEMFWVGFGLLGQGIFMSRFLVQWLYSEKEGKSVIPIYFWYLSLAGACILLTYAIHIRDIVFILGQSFGFLVYSRNLQLLARERRLKQAASNSTDGQTD